MIFYIIACVPLLVGGIFWAKNKRVAWQEWLGVSILAFLMAGTFHIYAIKGMTADIETWSGKITHATHYSAWREYYEEAIYRTEHYTTSESDGKGGRRTVHHTRRVFDHWAPRTRWHSEHWVSFSDIDSQYNINQIQYQEFVRKFEDETPVAGRRRTSEHNSKMIDGDPNDYVTSWRKTQWIEPVTKIVRWSNKIKAAPSVFSFIKVPTNIMVFEWPNNNNHFASDRVMGTAKKYINGFKWDVLNAKLGPKKYVNLIIIGFDSDDSMLGQYQQAKFVGGKKNDLVISLGGTNLHYPSWAHVFGWTDSEIVKRNIQSHVLQYGLSTNFMNFLYEEVVKNYKIKDWSKLDYIKVEPRISLIIWYIVWVSLIQGAATWWINNNEINKSYGEQQNIKNWSARRNSDFSSLRRS